MWPKHFEQRLDNWANLRDRCSLLPVEQAALEINQWWFQTPWVPYYLHWDDREFWPDPWQLLSDNLFCDVARGLGILYSISMLDRSDITDTGLCLTQAGHTIVQVLGEKYILNWEPADIVNKNLRPLEIVRYVSLEDVAKKY